MKESRFLHRDLVVIAAILFFQANSFCAGGLQLAKTGETVQSQTPAFSSGVRDVLKLLDAKVSPDVITAFINAYPSGFHLTADEIVILKNRGVSSEMLQAMVQHKAAIREQATASTQAPTQPATAINPAPVYVTPGYTYSAPYYSYYPPTYSYWYYNYSYPWWGASYTYWPSSYYPYHGYRNYWGWPYRGSYWHHYPYYGHGYGYPHYSGGIHNYYHGRAPGHAGAYAPVNTRPAFSVGHAHRPMMSAGYAGRPAMSHGFSGGQRSGGMATGFRGGHR